ncbi:MAG: dipeptidase, partial [Pirellulales bacterium]
ALSYNRDQRASLGEINRRESAMTDLADRGRATTCLPEMRRAGVATCLATLMARTKPEVQPTGGHRRTDLDYATQEIAYAVAQGQLAYYRLLEQQGEAVLLRTSRQLDSHWKQWDQAMAGDGEPAEQRRCGLPIGMILAMEGADPIVGPEQVEAWWEDGLRSVMLAHYGTSHYAVGTGASGPLSTQGRELLGEFERVGMILDITHLSEPSFFQAVDCFDGPLMASHSNCRALVPGDRQLSDQQLRLLIERDAVIGAVADAWMLVPGWQRGVSKPNDLNVSALVDHVDHVCQLAGNARHAAIGSDLDGGYGTEQTPSDLRTIADLRRLTAELRRRGYSDEDVEAIAHGNWLRFFRQWLPD